ncbi:MAG TPA: hypothetical protein VN224_13340, partial [Xanthomonadales bacterium]|nr:hypothetical protein [Xanthomonadales bacterium]
ASDNSGGGAMSSKALDQRAAPPLDGVPPAPPGMAASAQSTDQQDHDRLQGLFATVPAEDMIRKDLKDAAQHGSTAMRLGGCAGNT